MTAFVPKYVAFKTNLLLYRILNEQIGCKKSLVLFLFPHRTYVLGIFYNCLTEVILKNFKNIFFLNVLNTISLHNL